jgi:hypothetical protein
MVSYIIVKCLGCGQPLIARAGQRTKRCTYCGRNLDVSKLKIFAKATSARKATLLAIAMKTPKTERKFYDSGL